MKSKYLTVTALTKYIKNRFDVDPHLQNVWLTGEISNFNHHRSGHMYLTIKDDNARLQSVMFAGNNRRLKFTPENGMRVLIKGNISVFEPYGAYQLYINDMEPDGIGALYLTYENLKKRLHKEGYFDALYKQAIPAFPTEIGVITSPTGAAVKDIITTIKRRYPVVNITVIPVIVQGDSAGKSIVAGIDRANKMNTFDTLIVGRGGGSIEDLWGFNEEIVVKAIVASTTPIISAVGHETDTTLSDYAADLRAATPTGAAELAVPSINELKNNLIDKKLQLKQNIKINFQVYNAKFKNLKMAYAFHVPKQLLLKNVEHLDRLYERMRQAIILLEENKRNQTDQLVRRLAIQHPNKSLSLAENNVHNFKRQLIREMNQQLEQKSLQLQAVIDKLTIINPLHTMNRGFTISYKADNTIVKSTKEIAVNDQITTHLKDGYIISKVTDVKEE